MRIGNRRIPQLTKEWRFDEALALPWTSFGPKTSFVEFKVVKADFLAVKRLDSNLQFLLLSWLRKTDNELEEYRFRCTARWSEDILLPTFTLIDKPGLTKVAAARLFTLTQTSLQNQRRCLHLTDRPTFGATMVKEELTLFATYWTSQKRLVSSFQTALS